MLRIKSIKCKIYPTKALKKITGHLFDLLFEKNTLLFYGCKHLIFKSLNRHVVFFGNFIKRIAPICPNTDTPIVIEVYPSLKRYPYSTLTL